MYAVDFTNTMIVSWADGIYWLIDKLKVSEKATRGNEHTTIGGEDTTMDEKYTGEEHTTMDKGTHNDGRGAHGGRWSRGLEGENEEERKNKVFTLLYILCPGFGRVRDSFESQRRLKKVEGRKRTVLYFKFILVSATVRVRVSVEKKGLFQYLPLF
jgi:hypothetical protein